MQMLCLSAMSITKGVYDMLYMGEKPGQMLCLSATSITKGVYDMLYMGEKPGPRDQAQFTKYLTTYH